MKANEERNAFALIQSTNGQEVKLALQELRLSGRILPVGAALQVRHVFRSAESKPVEVVYAFGLPKDAALRQFRIVGPNFSVQSKLKRTAEAVKVYEKGIENGSLSSLARQYRDGVVNLSVGNIRPGETVAVYLEILAGVELRDDGLRFRFPFTLAPTYHAKARTFEAEPSVGEMELPEEFGDVLLPRWKKDATGLHRIGFEMAVALPQVIAEIGSPSHAITVQQGTNGQQRVSLAPAQEVPDRDLVLDIRTREMTTGVTGGIGKDRRGHFAVVVPTKAFGSVGAANRRLVFVVDRSGSMVGSAMAQARQAVEACLGALSKEDLFAVVAFDNRVECLAEQLLNGSRAGREAARKFLETVEARGGTDLAAGVLAAAKLLGTEGGDVLVLTDGQVSGTDTILAKVRSAGIRIHCLGIGSASQDRFLALLARVTGGVSRFVTARERVDMAAVELFASIAQPVACELKVSTGQVGGMVIAPEPPRFVFAGSPLVLFGQVRGRIKGKIRLTWQGPAGKQKLDVAVTLTKNADADAIGLLQGARLITDMEARLKSAEQLDGETVRRQNKALEKLSLKYGLASQALSLVAVVKRKGDKPGVLPKTIVVPVGLPQDTEFGAYFGGALLHEDATHYAICSPSSKAPPGMKLVDMPRSAIDDDGCVENGSGLIDGMVFYLARVTEPDGGMPGNDDEERWAGTATAVLYLFAKGQTSTTGTFRVHVKRWIAFLKTAPSTATEERKRQLMELIETETVLSGDWRTFARRLAFQRPRRVDAAAFWREAERAIVTAGVNGMK